MSTVFQNWAQFIILILSLISSVIFVATYLKKITTKEISAFILKQSEQCNIHKRDIVNIKETNMIMLECHDTTLEALENMAKGNKINGEIGQQRDKLRMHMLKQFSK